MNSIFPNFEKWVQPRVVYPNFRKLLILSTISGIFGWMVLILEIQQFSDFTVTFPGTEISRCQMERKFPVRNFRKYGYTSRGCPFFRNFRKMGAFHSTKNSGNLGKGANCTEIAWERSRKIWKMLNFCCCFPYRLCSIFLVHYSVVGTAN